MITVERIEEIIEANTKFEDIQFDEVIGAPYGFHNAAAALYTLFSQELSTLTAERDNPLVNAARGRDACGINHDEMIAAAKAVIKELVELKDMKDEFDKWQNVPLLQWHNAIVKMKMDYLERKPLAWDEARKFLKNN